MKKTLAYLKEKKELVDLQLQLYLKNDELLLNTLFEAIDYSLFSGGKRIRPLFCFLVGELFDVPEENLIPLACSLEMIHTASLIMDDLPHMDNADIRRGKAANHVVYGQDVAALATIGLLTKAYEVVLRDPVLPDAKKVCVVSRLARAVGINGMVGGQFVDLKLSSNSMEYATLEFIHTHKTASLFVATGITSAIIGNATEDEIKTIESYAKNLGFAFQILDDLLDLNGSTKDMGKSVNSDNGNFAILYGEEKSKQMIQECTNNAFDAIKIFGGKNKKLIALGQMLLKRKS